MCRILVVDDEPDLRFIMRRIFERAGHEVADAGHGAAALACLRESRWSNRRGPKHMCSVILRSSRSAPRSKSAKR